MSIEVMTGRSPKMALDPALWVGVKLEDAAVIDVGVDRINKYCERLQEVIDTFHDDDEKKRQLKKLVDEANAQRAHHFQVGELVMVTVSDTAMNPINTDNPRLRWQGPYEVVFVA